LTKGESIIKFIEAYCRVPEGSRLGKSIRLAPFQKKFILDVYDNPHTTTNGYLSIGRKNGKTALIAALVLAHLVGPVAIQNSHIISGARSRDQASFVYRLASKMVMMNEKLRALIRPVPSSKKLVGLRMNTEYQAISAEAKTALGNSPVLAILDEVGQVVGPQDDFVDAITTAQGAYEHPLLLAISTQAPTDGDLFSIWLDDAAQSDDPHTVSHVYAADEAADILDKEAWRAANPAMGLFRSAPDVERQAERAARMPSQENTFRNLILNQRVSTNTPFVSRAVWDENSGEPLPTDGQLVYGGLDLSARTDLTSLVLLFEKDGRKHVHPYFWTPEETLLDRSKQDRVPYDVWVKQGYIRTTPGKSIDYEFVVDDFSDILAGFELHSIRFDRWRIDVFKKELERAGAMLPIEPFGQGFRDMSPAVDALEEDLLNGKLCHGGNPVLKMCAANTVITQDAAGNRKFDKAKSVGRIDGMVALAMSYGAFNTYEEAEPVFDVAAIVG